LLEQSSFTAFATDLASAARNAFLTVERQERSCAVNADALEATTARARDATARVKINFKTGFLARCGVMNFLSDGIAGAESREYAAGPPSAKLRIQHISPSVLGDFPTDFLEEMDRTFVKRAKGTSVQSTDRA
jgi:hypothetical protein